MRKPFLATLSFVFWFCLECSVWSWTTDRLPPVWKYRRSSNQQRLLNLLLVHATLENFESEPNTETRSKKSEDSVRPLCFYRSPLDNKWKPRMDVENLVVGQELQGIIVQEKLTNYTTGPKLWLDVGVSRWSTKSDPQGAWTICTAMLRLGHANQKESALRKKVARLRSKKVLTVYVSRIRLEQGQFEVVLTAEEVPPPATVQLQAISNLTVGDEVTGTIERVEDYGVLIRMDGYNRHGLLHIRQVASLYGTYIDKQRGLIDAGLDQQSRVKLQVMQKDAKRIFLDFTEDVKRFAAGELVQKEREETEKQNQLREQLQSQREAPVASYAESKVSASIDSEVTADLSETVDEDDEFFGDSEEEEDEEYDSYDEERDIEDALGLGTY